MASASQRAPFLGQGRGRGRGIPQNSSQKPGNVFPIRTDHRNGKEVKKEGNNDKPSQERLHKAHMIKQSAKKFVDENSVDDSSEDEDVEDDNIISSTLKIYNDTSQGLKQ